MKRIYSLLLALLLVLLPWLALATTSAFDLSALTDKELLALQKEVEAEIASRGLSLSSGIPSSASQATSLPDPLVWIPKSGGKYHSKSTCSNMTSPNQLTLSEANRLGYAPCSKCNPPR